MARAKISLSNLLDREEDAPDLPPELPTPAAAVTLGPAAAPDEAIEAADGAVVEADSPLVDERALTVGADQSPVAVAPPAAPEPVVASELVEPTTVALAPQTASDELASATVAAEYASVAEPVPAAEPKPAKSRTNSAVRAIKAAPEPPPSAPYLDLTRKEARFRPDQLNELTTLTRQLNRRRGSTGERITDNTLIRVAVDMLLRVADSLDGASEEELLQSVGSRLR